MTLLDLGAHPRNTNADADADTDADAGADARVDTDARVDAERSICANVVLVNVLSVVCDAEAEAWGEYACLGAYAYMDVA